MNEKIAKSDMRIILEMKERYNFIVISIDNAVHLSRFKKRLKMNKDSSDEETLSRFGNALQRCLETGKCTVVAGYYPPLFDFSRGQASDKYW